MRSNASSCVDDKLLVRATSLGCVVISLWVPAVVITRLSALPLNSPLYFSMLSLLTNVSPLATAQAYLPASRTLLTLQLQPLLPLPHQTTRYHCGRHRRPCRSGAQMQHQRRRVISLTGCCSHWRVSRCSQPSDQRSARRTGLRVSRIRRRPGQQKPLTRLRRQHQRPAGCCIVCIHA